MTEENASKYLKLLTDLSSTITQNTNHVEHEINDHFDEIIQILNTRRHQLLDNINKSKSSLLNEINSEITTIDDNNNTNSSEYLTNKLLSLSKSYQFTSDIDASSFTDAGTINETENNYIVPIITITSIQRNIKKSNHPTKCCIKLKWQMQNLENINNDNALKNSTIKFQNTDEKSDNNNWIVAEYDSINIIENNVFECILDAQFRFNYDENYSFQIEYKTDAPLKMTVFSEIKCSVFKSSESIDEVCDLVKYCNWFEYSPLNCDAKMLKNWRQRKKQMLEFVKYIGDEGTQSDEEDENFSMKRESTSVELNDVIKQCSDDYQKFLNLNDDKLSYCLYDFLQLNQTKIERDKLWKIFDGVEELKLLHINIGIISIIGSYIAVIYARAADSAYVHFSYGGILPNKHIYENLTFRRRDKKIRVTNDRNRLYGEVVYIFEKNHCDPSVITESTYSQLDVVIYYEEHGIYSITQIDDDANSVEFVDLKLHRDFIKTQLL